eukprot:16114866-Heterocapsa_arctica.AAC.1
MLRRLLGCCRRHRPCRAVSVLVLARWTAVLRHLRRLRSRQWYFAYLGHHLQTYPAWLRLRLRGLR